MEGIGFFQDGTQSPPPDSLSLFSDNGGVSHSVPVGPDLRFDSQHFGHTIRLAPSDERYMHKYEKLMEIRWHEKEHVSKMEFLKTHSHTYERRG